MGQRCSTEWQSLIRLAQHLSQLQRDPIPVTDDVLISALIGDFNAMGTLLEKWETPIGKGLFFEACSHCNLLPVLLDKRCDCAPVDQIVSSFKDATRPPSGWVLEALMEQQLVDVNEELLETISQYQALVEGAKDIRSIRLLLDKVGSETPITDDIIAGTTAAIEQQPWYYQETIESIIRRTGSVPITEKVFRAALSNDLAGLLPWLSEQRPDLEISLTTLVEDIWQDRNTPPEKKIQAFEGFAELHFEMDRLDEVEITTSMLEDFPYDSELKENYGLDEIVVDVIAEVGPALRIPELDRLAEIIVERRGNKAVDAFLDSGLDAPIKDGLIEAAMRNVIADQETLISRLKTLRSY